MDNLIETMTFFLGKAICHQIPERTFLANGQYMPICARCTGIYLGVFFSLLYLAVTKRFRSDTIPSVKISFFLLLFLLPLVVDGFGSYLGFYSTTNLIRVMTGVMFGVTLPIFVVPLANRSTQLNRRVISNLWSFLATIIIASILAILTSLGLIPFVILNTLIIGVMISWVALLFFLFFKKMKNNYYAISISYVCSIMILAALSSLHSYVESIIDIV